MSDWRYSLESIFQCDPATYDHLIRFSTHFRVAYIECPKAASSTIHASLAGIGSALGPDATFSSFSALEEVGAKLPAAEAVLFSNDFYRFSAIRNPYTRILSSYLDKVVQNEWEWKRLRDELGFKKRPNFRTFLHRIGELDPVWVDIHFRSQARILNMANIEYHRLIRFERFGQEFAVLQHEAGLIGDADGPVINTVNHHATGARRAVEERRQVEERAYVELSRLYALVEGGYEALAINLEAIQAAELSVLANEKSYEGGVRTNVDVVNAIQTRFEVQNAYVQAATQLGTNYLNLLLLAGESPEYALELTQRFLLGR